MEDWTQLYGSRISHFTSAEINPNRPPCLAAFCATDNANSVFSFDRNHYWFFFDPEGNQLPYTDGLIEFGMERDAAIFRSMNGEQDGSAKYYTIGEMPLFTANMEKGDYSLFQWVDPGGMDMTIALNHAYNEDPELGMWIRTKDFRVALSHAMDREQINDTIFLG